MCGIKCRLMFGAKRLHNFFEKGEGHRWESSCAEFNLNKTQDGPPTDYRVDYNGEFECFTSCGFTNYSGTPVGNTTVKCNVTWVLSWFPHANMKPIFEACVV